MELERKDLFFSSERKQENWLEDFLEKSFEEVIFQCITQIQSSFFTLSNSFFVVADRNQVILKSFINKCSNVDITEYVPTIGSYLKEIEEEEIKLSIKDMGKSAAKLIKNKLSGQSADSLTNITMPIGFKGELVGYLRLATLNKENINILKMFMESLGVNIEREFQKRILEEKIITYMDEINQKPKEKFNGLFSEKERIIIGYILRAYSNSAIASELGVSETTVKTYLKRIYEKCGTSNRVDTTITVVCNNFMENL